MVADPCSTFSTIKVKRNSWGGFSLKLMDRISESLGSNPKLQIFYCVSAASRVSEFANQTALTSDGSAPL